MNHLAVVLDGNRRYARKYHKPIQWGHDQGAKLVEDLISWVIELKIPMLTLYALSLKNMNRFGISILYKLIENELRKAAKDKKVHSKKIRFNIIGRRNGLPPSLLRAMDELEEATKNYRKIQVNLAIAYDGRAELVDAFKKIAEEIKNSKIKIKEINEDFIQKNLYLTQPPELIIRTGGEQRLSGFLLWGSSYSEFYFTPKLWPEFTRDDLIQALEEFDSRERRYGL
jgi:tritrans,polycis-undecaprenyl-diphosphate synthase [geranylgeranyl-diphosphate specific]